MWCLHLALPVKRYRLCYITCFEQTIYLYRVFFMLSGKYFEIGLCSSCCKRKKVDQLHLMQSQLASQQHLYIAMETPLGITVEVIRPVPRAIVLVLNIFIFIPNLLQTSISSEENMPQFQLIFLSDMLVAFVVLWGLYLERLHLFRYRIYP